MIKKYWLHFKLVTKHRWIVFKLAVKAGIPWRGFVHDLSKYSFEEFLESAKFYTGKRSPITIAREEQGYSRAWLHHKGRNKHHPEYWYDWNSKEPRAIVPYKYAVEMVCDQIAAGMAYKGKEWKNDYTLYYWDNVEKSRKLYHPCIEKFLTIVKTDLSKKDMNEVMNKKYLKKVYNECCNKEEKVEEEKH